MVTCESCDIQPGTCKTDSCISPDLFLMEPELEGIDRDSDDINRDIMVCFFFCDAVYCCFHMLIIISETCESNSSSKAPSFIVHLLILLQFSTLSAAKPVPLRWWNCLFRIFPTKSASSASYKSSCWILLRWPNHLHPMEVANAALRWGVHMLCVFHYLMS